jgi:hypothetical protein
LILAELVAAGLVQGEVAARRTGRERYLEDFAWSLISRPWGFISVEAESIQELVWSNWLEVVFVKHIQEACDAIDDRFGWFPFSLQRVDLIRHLPLLWTPLNIIRML